MYVRAGRPAFARPYVGVHRSTSLMSSSLLLQQCPAGLVRLTGIVFVMGGKWPYSWCFVGCCRQDSFNIARNKDLPEAMKDWEKWRERVRDIRASGTSWWWSSSSLRKFQFILMYILDIRLRINCPILRRCTWCNGYRRRTWTWRHEFKPWMRLIAFHIALIPLGKVWIQLFSLQLCVNSRTD